MNFTLAQLTWAAQHDWYISGDIFKIVCRDDLEPDHIKTFTDFATLRNWAGY